MTIANGGEWSPWASRAPWLLLPSSPPPTPASLSPEEHHHWFRFSFEGFHPIPLRGFDIIWVPIEIVNNPLTIGLKTAALRSSGQNLCEKVLFTWSFKCYFLQDLLHSSWAEPRTRMGRRSRERERGILFLNPFTCFKRPVLSPKILFSRNSVSLFFTLDTSHPCVQPAGGAQRCSYQTWTAMR